MIVIADTSPLNYLVQIEADGLLPVLYRQVVVPPAVLAELRNPLAPAAVQSWLQSLPLWLIVKPTSTEPDNILSTPFVVDRKGDQRRAGQHSQLDWSVRICRVSDERKGLDERAELLAGLVTTGSLKLLAGGCAAASE